jgi:8-oxo-dGTP diphosphatase
MEREYPSGPIPAVGGVVVEDDRVLLVKRATEPGRGSWSIPGGVVGLGERLEEALRRELLEETGLLVRALGLVDVAERILWLGERVQYHYVILDYVCVVEGGTLTPSSDAQEARWFKPQEIPALGLSARAMEIIEKGMRMARGVAGRGPGPHCCTKGCDPEEPE